MDFYPRPPRGGRPLLPVFRAAGGHISIHALREEGDPAVGKLDSSSADFYPRPPRGGRRQDKPPSAGLDNFYPRPPRGGRHQIAEQAFPVDGHFYPRPPRGGRPAGGRHGRPNTWIFLSTPSARRATPCLWSPAPWQADFYPRPPRGGRHRRQLPPQIPSKNFYPRPPRGGRRKAKATGRITTHFYPRPPRGGRRFDKPTISRC